MFNPRSLYQEFAEHVTNFAQAHEAVHYRFPTDEQYQRTVATIVILMKLFATLKTAFTDLTIDIELNHVQKPRTINDLENHLNINILLALQSIKRDMLQICQSYTADFACQNENFPANMIRELAECMAADRQIATTTATTRIAAITAGTTGCCGLSWKPDHPILGIKLKLTAMKSAAQTELSIARTAERLEKVTLAIAVIKNAVFSCDALPKKIRHNLQRKFESIFAIIIRDDFVKSVQLCMKRTGSLLESLLHISKSPSAEDLAARGEDEEKKVFAEPEDDVHASNQSLMASLPGMVTQAASTSLKIISSQATITPSVSQAQLPNSQSLSEISKELHNEEVSIVNRVAAMELPLENSGFETKQELAQTAVSVVKSLVDHYNTLSQLQELAQEKAHALSNSVSQRSFTHVMPTTK